MGVEEDAQWLKAHAALAKDPCSVPLWTVRSPPVTSVLGI